MWFSHIAIDFVFVLDMVILYFLAIRFKRYKEVISQIVLIYVFSLTYPRNTS